MLCADLLLAPQRRMCRGHPMRPLLAGRLLLHGRWAPQLPAAADGLRPTPRMLCEVAAATRPAHLARLVSAPRQLDGQRGNLPLCLCHPTFRGAPLANMWLPPAAAG